MKAAATPARCAQRLPKKERRARHVGINPERAARAHEDVCALSAAKSTRSRRPPYVLSVTSTKAPARPPVHARLSCHVSPPAQSRPLFYEYNLVRSHMKGNQSRTVL